MLWRVMSVMEKPWLLTFLQIKTGSHHWLGSHCEWNASLSGPNRWYSATLACTCNFKWNLISETWRKVREASIGGESIKACAGWKYFQKMSFIFLSLPVFLPLDNAIQNSWNLFLTNNWTGLIFQARPFVFWLTFSHNSHPRNDQLNNYTLRECLN